MLSQQRLTSREAYFFRARIFICPTDQKSGFRSRNLCTLCNAQFLLLSEQAEIYIVCAPLFLFPNTTYSIRLTVCLVIVLFLTVYVFLSHNFFMANV